MRHLMTAALTLVLGLAAWPAAAADLGPANATGEVEIGGRAVTGDDWGDSQFQEYRSIEPGVFGRAQALVEDDAERYFFDFEANDIAEDDQGYRIGAGRYNRYRIELQYQEFDQIHSGGKSLTLHSEQGKGVLRLPDSVQDTVEAAPAGAARAAALQTAYANAFPVTLRSAIKDARAGFFFRATPSLEVNVGYRLTQKKGTQPWSVGFGSPGGTFANVAAPIDQVIHEVSAGVGYSRGSVAVRFEYVGSFFDNDIDTLIVDNPIAGPGNGEAAASPTQGRVDMAPDNSAHTFTLTGTSALPTPFPVQATGTLSYGLRLQDDDFIPHTINSATAANPALVLPANDLDGKVHTYLAMLKLAGKPSQRLNTSVFYRFYMYDNQTDELTIPGHVVNDAGAVVVETRFVAPFEYFKQNAGIDLNYTVSRPLSTRLGFEWERWNRNEHREVRVTDEYITRLGATLRPARWVQLKADARAGFRIGQGYDTFAHIAHTVEEADAATLAQTQSPLLRKYDEANRRLYRGDLGVSFLPEERVTVGLKGGYSYADYYDSQLGIRDSWAWNAGTDVEYRPIDWLGLNAFYVFDVTRYDQRSRWRPVPVNDTPINNWESTSTDYGHTAGLGADVDIIADTLDFSLAYLVEHARTKTRSSSTPGTTNAANDGGNAFNWPTEKDWLHSLVAALRYHVMQNLSVKAEYRLELYNLTSFRWDGLDPIEPASSINGSGGGVGTGNDVFLPYPGLDYTANVLALSLIYRF